MLLDINELLLHLLYGVMDRVKHEGPALLHGMGDGIVAKFPHLLVVSGLLQQVVHYLLEALSLELTKERQEIAPVSLGIAGLLEVPIASELAAGCPHSFSHHLQSITELSYEVEVLHISDSETEHEESPCLDCWLEPAKCHPASLSRCKFPPFG